MKIAAAVETSYNRSMCHVRFALALVFIMTAVLCRAENARKPLNDADLKRWLENMIWHHRFSTGEVQAATGLSEAEIKSALERFKISPATRPKRVPDAPLLVLPYPGGRHPRIGFLEGAVDPQRETKLSIFTPWDDASYVVGDVPEAIWSNLGLTYLAHTHIDTIWSAQKIELPPQEWQRLKNGDYRMERTLPNGIRFGTLARTARDAVLMKMWVHNGTTKTLSDLRVQNCVMLKNATGFNAQTNANKVLRAPFAAAHSEDRKRWVITAWRPIHRAWANPPVPCVHADPKFPDTAPGETKLIYGRVSFYEGDAIEEEFLRIEKGWGEQMNF